MYVSDKHWAVSLYISSPAMKMDPKEANASNFGCSQASDWQRVWNRECEWSVLQSFPPAGTNCGRFFLHHFWYQHRFLRWSWHRFGPQRLVIAHVATTDTCLFPEHSDSCWRCCLVFLIERHEHFYSIVALTKAHTFFIIIIMLTYTHCLRMME